MQSSGALLVGNGRATVANLKSLSSARPAFFRNPCFGTETSADPPPLSRAVASRRFIPPQEATALHIPTVPAQAADRTESSPQPQDAQAKATCDSPASETEELFITLRLSALMSGGALTPGNRSGKTPASVRPSRPGGRQEGLAVTAAHVALCPEPGHRPETLGRER